MCGGGRIRGITIDPIATFPYMALLVADRVTAKKDNPNAYAFSFLSG